MCVYCCGLMACCVRVCLSVELHLFSNSCCVHFKIVSLCLHFYVDCYSEAIEFEL
ncbi:hypothetical protein HanPI659440_Chr10g0367131 [Helianthus annuus]|nr:hypothetical protein HanPI659440_Chr10g0367131 [Helianthus annuus]